MSPCMTGNQKTRDPDPVDVDDLIVVQPFTATDDPSVLGIKPMPRLQERIQELLHKYQAENIDIADIEYEEADLEESALFPPTTQENDNGGAEEKNIL